MSTALKLKSISDYPCYRDYVVVALPQLQILDGKEITRTERLKAKRSFEENRREIIQLQVGAFNSFNNFSLILCLIQKSFSNHQAKYQITRDEQKLRVAEEIQSMENVDLDDEEKLKEWVWCSKHDMRR